VIRVLGGRYRLVETLGGGGTSLVHRAEPLDGGPAVAIKQLRPQLAAEPALRRRFLREADLARGLEHAGIVRLLDTGEEAGVPYLVLELVNAPTLRQRLARGGPLPSRTAWSVFVALARALDHAHRHGVIHRDVKPENVFVDGWLVKLGDFGNARVVSLASVTGASLSWGTPEYVAPETFTRGRADPRSDLFSLGVVLYEMLTGKLPWSRAETLTRISGRSATAPRLPPTGAGEAIDALVTELLAFSPGDRPASGEEIVLRYAEPGTVAIAPRKSACSACGAPRPDDVPRCLACGAEALRLRHTPGARWGLVLRKLGDDAAETETLLRLLDGLAQPPERPLVFLTGVAHTYSKEEMKAGIPLPVALLCDLDRDSATALAELFQRHGLDVGAVEGTAAREVLAPIRVDLRALAGTSLLTGLVLGLLSHHPGVGATLGGALAVASVLLVKVSRWRRPARQVGLVKLREQLAPAPAAERLLADAAGAAAGVRAPEVRELLGDVAVEVYRLTRRAAQLGGRQAAPSSEADLLRRMTAAAPALMARLTSVAGRLDALDAALDGASEGEIMQTLGRLERAAAAPGADVEALRAARRDAEAALQRRHAAEHERARLAAGLCALLGRLRHVYRRAAALQTLGEQEAATVEAASAHLEAWLVQ
jgi:hypothetical protein